LEHAAPQVPVPLFAQAIVHHRLAAVLLADMVGVDVIVNRVVQLFSVGDVISVISDLGFGR
jgi:hypothetical protein